MLSKWDAKREIARDQVYKKLSVKRKQDLLGHLALKTFEKEEYFFKQKQAEHHIADFIQHLADQDPDPEALQCSSLNIDRSPAWDPNGMG